MQMIVVTPSARFIALGRSRAGSCMSPTANVMTLNPRKAKNVNATLATMSDTDGYSANASMSRSMLGSVTTTNTARIPTMTNTISDCAFATNCGPVTTTKAIATTIKDV